jgi:hypothetical protein
VRLEYDEYVRQRRVYYMSERRWPDHFFWRTRLPPPHTYSGQ